MAFFFQPKILTTIREYSVPQFVQDCVAGLIVGIVAIPLAIAFAIASGVSPEKGLFTAIVAGFLVSALGGSRVQIGGPTGAFVVIVYGVVEKYGVDGLILATFLAGLILVLMGFARFGAAIKFIPHSVIVGFTSGIAVIIFSSEVKDFLGLQTGPLPGRFIEKWRVLVEHLPSADPRAAAVALFTVVLVAVWPRISRKVPGALVALILTSIAVRMLGWPIETIGSRFGELPHTLPMPKLPSVDLSALPSLVQPAFTIALLGAIESLLSAVVADGMVGTRHRSDTELVAQGLANMGSAMVGGIPATGAIARTATNVKNGGRTPVAGMMHALTILLVMLFFGKWIKLVPLACLAGILTVVAYNMSEWRSFRELLKGSRGAILVLFSTFLLTVFVDLTAAIEIGVVLSAFLFINRMAGLTNVSVISDEVREKDEEEGHPSPINTFRVPAGVEVYEINGPFFFGAAHKFEEAMRVLSKRPKVRILRLRNVPLIDSTGLHALKSFHKKCLSQDTRLLIAGLHAQPLNEMIKNDLYDLIGEENVFANIGDALAAAERALGGKKS